MGLFDSFNDGSDGLAGKGVNALSTYLFGPFGGAASDYLMNRFQGESDEEKRARRARNKREEFASLYEDMSRGREVDQLRDEAIGAQDEINRRNLG